MSAGRVCACAVAGGAWPASRAGLAAPHAASSRPQANSATRLIGTGRRRPGSALAAVEAAVDQVVDPAVDHRGRGLDVHVRPGGVAGGALVADVLPVADL